jgi:hypothetical protein
LPKSSESNAVKQKRDEVEAGATELHICGAGFSPWIALLIESVRPFHRIRLLGQAETAELANERAAV